MAAQLTLILHNWVRPGQLADVVHRLRGQTCAPQIFIWDNKPGHLSQAAISEADLYVSSSRNTHLGSFFYLARLADTPFVGRIDDDLYPADSRIFADALTVLERQPADRIIGSSGTLAKAGCNYHDSLHVNGKSSYRSNEVDLVRGRLMLLRREALLCCRPLTDCPHIDLTMSFDLAGRRRKHHLIPAVFHDRILDFPEDNNGYCNQGNHYEARDALLQAWLKECEGTSAAGTPAIEESAQLPDS